MDEQEKREPRTCRRPGCPGLLRVYRNDSHTARYQCTVCGAIHNRMEELSRVSTVPLSAFENMSIDPEKTLPRRS